MHFKNLPNHLKPREKALLNGVKSLNDIELLALLVRSGSSKGDVLDVSRNIITRFGSLKNIKYSSIKELTKIDGIGEIKSLELMTLFEFANRINKETPLSLSDNYQAIEFGKKLIGDNEKEMFLLVITNKNDEVIYKEVMYKGTAKDVSVDPKEVVSLILKKDGSKFYCFHNHPSGDVRPSEADKLITTRLLHYSQLFGIEMKFHAVVNNKGDSYLIE